MIITVFRNHTASGCPVNKTVKNILEYIVNVSSRYLTNRHFPDKAFDLLDDACSVTKVKNKNSDKNE